MANAGGIEPPQELTIDQRFQQLIRDHADTDGYVGACPTVTRPRGAPLGSACSSRVSSSLVATRPAMSTNSVELHGAVCCAPGTLCVSVALRSHLRSRSESLGMLLHRFSNPSLDKHFVNTLVNVNMVTPGSPCHTHGWHRVPTLCFSASLCTSAQPKSTRICPHCT